MPDVPDVDDKMQARNGSYSEERPQIAKCCLGCLRREGVLSRPVILPFVEFRFRAKLYQPKNWCPIKPTNILVSEFGKKLSASKSSASRSSVS